jgi:hypothetical protein
MPTNLQGIQDPYSLAATIRNNIYAFASQWYANRCPLVTRIPRVPVGSVTFSIVSSNFRPRTGTLNAAVANNVVTTITVTDASPYMIGDVLELANNSERVMVTANPDTTNNTLTVTRGVEGTTAAAANNSTTVTLIGNARTGGEVDQQATAYTPSAVAQYCQTFQHPVQVSGSLQSSTDFALPPGITSPLQKFEMEALQNLMDDIEVTSYLGKGTAPSSGGRPTQKGLKTLIDSGNVVTSPTNASAYKSTDLIRDTLQAARSDGGNPDVLFVSSNFMSGIATWGQPLSRLDAGTNVFGTPIDVFEAPFLNGVTVIEAPLLPSYTAFCLTSGEVRMRMKRNEFWSPRGNRGDAFEGDYIAEGAIELGNPAHHAWVQGITAFSA